MNVVTCIITVVTGNFSNRKNLKLVNNDYDKDKNYTITIIISFVLIIQNIS